MITMHQLLLARCPKHKHGVNVVRQVRCAVVSAQFTIFTVVLGVERG